MANRNSIAVISIAVIVATAIGIYSYSRSQSIIVRNSNGTSLPVADNSNVTLPPTSDSTPNDITSVSVSCADIGSHSALETLPQNSIDVGPLASYKSTVYGYSFTYPAAWLQFAIDNPGDSSVELSNIDPPEQGTFQDQKQVFRAEIHAVDNPKHLSLEQWIAENNDGPEPAEFLGCRNMIIAGVPAELRVIAGYFGNDYIAYVPYKSVIFLIRGPSVTSDFAPVFIRLLSSFSINL